MNVYSTHHVLLKKTGTCIMPWYHTASHIMLMVQSLVKYDQCADYKLYFHHRWWQHSHGYSTVGSVSWRQLSKMGISSKRRQCHILSYGFMWYHMFLVFTQLFSTNWKLEVLPALALGRLGHPTWPWEWWPWWHGGLVSQCSAGCLETTQVREPDGFPDW